MKKLLFTVLSALCILLMPAVQAAPTIDIGLVVSQYSAEVEAPAGFIITLPDGSREEYGVGKYFFSAGQGRIRLDKKTYPDGIVLTLQEPKEPAAKAASGKAPAVSKRPAAQRLLSVNKQECPGNVCQFRIGSQVVPHLAGRGHQGAGRGGAQSGMVFQVAPGRVPLCRPRHGTGFLLRRGTDR